MRTTKKPVVGARFGAVIAAAVLFVVGLGWLALPPAPLTAVPQAQRQADDAGRHHAEAQTQVPRAMDARGGPTERDNRAGPEHRQTESDGPSATDVIEAASAAVTTLFTGVLTWIAFKQFRISDTQAKVAREQAAIMREQARTARILADLEQPVLFVHRIDRTDMPHGGGAQPSARVHFANYGRTPAVLLRVEADIILTRRPPLPPEYDEATTRKNLFQIVEAGKENAEFVDITGRPLPDGGAAPMPGGLYAYGKLIYRDPFGGHAETGFGQLLGSGPHPGLPPFDAYNYRKANDPGGQDTPHA